MSVNSKMTAIADKIRALLGITGAMGMDAMATNLGNAVTEVDSQAALIQQIKDGLTETEENMGKTNAEIDTQSDIIQQIKTALEGKAGGGTVLPALTNPGTAIDLAEGKQLIDGNGQVVVGTVKTVQGSYFAEYSEIMENDEYISPYLLIDQHTLLREGVPFYIDIPKNVYGNATAEDVAQGKTFTSENGLKITGTGSGGGMVVKSGTTTGRTIDTGLSDVEQFFLYKESMTSTGLIHLHYTKSATSRMYASAWSTQNYGTKTITNGTDGVTVSGGTVTISATQATQGALSSNVTYKWIAVGTE